MITEITLLPIQPNAKISDSKTPAGSAWAKYLATIASQPGFHRYYWGLQVKHPEILEILVGMTSLFSFPLNTPVPIPAAKRTINWLTD
jgi:hypothetical protein